MALPARAGRFVGWWTAGFAGAAAVGWGLGTSPSAADAAAHALLAGLAAWALSGSADGASTARVPEERPASFGLAPEVAADLAHDLRNALFAFSANVDALEVTPDGSDDRREVFVALRNERDRLASVSEDLAALGETAAGAELKEDALGPVLREAVHISGAVAQRYGVGIELDLAGEWRVAMGRESLIRAFGKMIGSSCRRASRGTLRLRAESFERDGRPWVRCTLRSDGPGERRDVPRSIAAAGPRGDALSLAVAEPIVARHGGRVVGATGQAGVGSVIGVELPCARGDAT